MRISRHLRSMRSFLEPPKRVRSSASSSIPLYQLPDVVLDLDAEDCPHVRPYDDACAAAEAARWRQAHASVDALQTRLAAFAQGAAEAETRMHAVLNTPSPWRVTDRDLLAVALHAADEGLLYENGVPAWADTPSQAIRFLMHRQGLAQRRAWAAAATAATAASTTRSNARALDVPTALARCTSWVALRRLVVLASRSTAGSVALLRAGPAVAGQLQEENQNRARVVVLLLNLSHSLADKGLVLDRALWALGLRAAAAIMEPAAMQHFLAVGLSAGYLDADQDENAVGDALTIVYTALRASDQPPRGSLAALLAVVADAEGSSSFRAALRRGGGSCLWPRYHGILGELGAVQTLWAEQQGAGGVAVDTDTLVRAVQRYAFYTAAKAERSMQERTGAAGAAQTDAGRHGYEGEDEWRSDGQMLRAYEAGETGETGETETGEAEAGEAGLEMLRQTMTKRAMTKSEMFREAAAAFGRATVHECMAEIGRVVVQHGLSSRVRRASK